MVSPSPANAQSLGLSVRPDGFAWAVWGDTRSTSQDIWGSRYDPNLNSWSAPVRLDDDPGSTAAQLNATVAFGAAETMLSWRDNRLSANGDTQARRILFIAGMTDHFALTYDGLNRATVWSGPVSDTFALDGASNISTRSGVSQTYDTANRQLVDGSTAYTWSNADRLTNRGSDTFGYDPLDRLTSSTVGGASRTYAYNADGLLQSRTQGTSTTFLWDPQVSPSRELKQGNDNIVYGLGPLYVVKADTTTVTFARDGGKNVRAEVSSSGTPTAAFRYRSYGQLAQTTGGAPAYLGFASQSIDPSGLYFMRARWYDPVTGRFVTRDPAGTNPADPQSLNGFAYGSANPASFFDPSGLASIADDGGGCTTLENCKDKGGIGIGDLLDAAGSILSGVVSTVLREGAVTYGGAIEGIGLAVHQTETAVGNGVTVISRSAGIVLQVSPDIVEVKHLGAVSSAAKAIAANPATAGALSGLIQLGTDYMNPNLSDAQVAQRSGISFGLGLLVGAAALVLVAATAPAWVVIGGAVVVGLTLDLVAKPALFKAAGAGG